MGRGKKEVVCRLDRRKRRLEEGKSVRKLLHSSKKKAMKSWSKLVTERGRRYNFVKDELIGLGKFTGCMG